jgi:hypothetical protein
MQIMRIVLPIAVFLGMVGLICASQWRFYSYCSSMSAAPSLGFALASAREKGLTVFDYRKESPPHVVALNHQAPYFRLACRIEIPAQGPAIARVMGDD